LHAQEDPRRRGDAAFEDAAAERETLLAALDAEANEQDASARYAHPRNMAES
jgi:hypothetical protein